MAGFIFGLMVVVFIGWILIFGSIASSIANTLLGCPESKDDKYDKEYEESMRIIKETEELLRKTEERKNRRY